MIKPQVPEPVYLSIQAWADACGKDVWSASYHLHRNRVPGAIAFKRGNGVVGYIIPVGTPWPPIQPRKSRRGWTYRKADPKRVAGKLLERATQAAKSGYFGKLNVSGR